MAARVRGPSLYPAAAAMYTRHQNDAVFHRHCRFWLKRATPRGDAVVGAETGSCCRSRDLWMRKAAERILKWQRELRAGFLSSLRHQGRARAEFAWRPTPFYTSVCGAWSPCRADYEDFLQDLEEDGDLKANVNIYKDSTTGGAADEAQTEFGDDDLKISLDEVGSPTLG